MLLANKVIDSETMDPNLMSATNFVQFQQQLKLLENGK